MTEAKKLKQTIRARARKTGESYTAARRQVLAARRRATPATPAAPPAAPAAPARKTAPAGRVVNEKGVLEKTGHDLAHWFGVLDAFGPAMGHAAMARHLSEDHGVRDWYCQMITVTYERERGLRAMNQACSGDFQVSVSRVVPATVAEVADLLGQPKRRGAWLHTVDRGLREAFEAAFHGPKARKVRIRDENTATFRFPWGNSRVDLNIYARPNGKASVGVGNTKLAGPEAVEGRRAVWAQALDALRAQLGR
jgi:hypothetical protein